MALRNSGKIKGTLISTSGRVITHKIGSEYCISSGPDKVVEFNFHTDNELDKLYYIDNPPLGSTLIINGHIRQSQMEVEIFPGMTIKN